MNETPLDDIPTPFDTPPPPLAPKLSHGMTPAGLESRAAVLRRHGWLVLPPGMSWFRRVWAVL